MTKEEIIRGLEFTIGMLLFNPILGETYTEPRNADDKITFDACRGAIELLKQEPVIDRIRAEIKSLERFEIKGEVTPLVNVDKVLEIIDKAESEPQESEVRDADSNNNRR